MVKFYNYDIVFQEIPNKVSLALNITNCQNNCKGCHSPYLNKDTGEELTIHKLASLIKNNIGVNCVVFMGEGNDKQSLLNLIMFVKEFGVEVGLYSGRDEIDVTYLNLLDYYKIGSFCQEKGGLKSKNTNQKFYKIENKTLIDLTYKFHEDK